MRTLDFWIFGETLATSIIRHVTDLSLKKIGNAIIISKMANVRNQKASGLQQSLSVIGYNNTVI